MITPKPPPDQDIKAEVLAMRSRMMSKSVPEAAVASTLFVLGFVGLVAWLQGGWPDALTFTWLGLCAGVSIIFCVHAYRYNRANDRSAPYWRTTTLGLVFALSCAWAAGPWLLPLHGHLDLAIALAASTIGAAGNGASALSADRLGARLFIVPMLVSMIIYSLTLGGPFGTFGVAGFSFYLYISWREAQRTHRMYGQLLAMRVQSDHAAAHQIEARLEAERLNATKGRYFAAMSHEMRTPLHGMLGLSRMLVPAVAGQQEAAQRLNLLQGAGQHLLRVINDVLDFSRLQEGLLALRPHPHDLHALLQEVCALMDVCAREKGVALVLQAQLPSPCWVDVDAARLKQILINLLGNAVKFTDQGRVVLRVVAGVQRPGQSGLVRFEVEDSGIGIPEHELAQVFEAFHQVDSGNDVAGAGSGLGLSIALQICRAMGGELTCESRLGVGSVFRFALPLKPALPSARPSSSLAEMHAQRPELAGGHDDDETPLSGTVLLVDDNPVNVIVAQAELVQLGLRVEVAHNGQQALDWLALHEADLILMDCHMPEMDGYTATLRIRQIESQRQQQQQRPAVPIVALTATMQDEELLKCKASGMNDYLCKPFATDDMKRMLHRYLPARSIDRIDA